MPIFRRPRLRSSPVSPTSLRPRLSREGACFQPHASPQRSKPQCEQNLSEDEIGVLHPRHRGPTVVTVVFGNGACPIMAMLSKDSPCCTRAFPGELRDGT